MIEETYKDKYYRVKATINLDAISKNIETIKSKVSKGTKIMAVIKADGYGHGAIPIARELDALVDYYAVAIVEEAIELRNAGITKPILILGYTPKEQLAQVVDYDITATIFQYELAKALDEEAKSQGKEAKVHIKVDTGMNRIGYRPNEQSINELVKVNQLSNIKIEGIFTHFACADMEDKTSTNHQFADFMNFVNELESRNVVIPIKHASNSAGILELRKMDLNMVRSGISTYGLYPSEEVDHMKLVLEPAMEIKTHIAYVKEVEAGQGIGYGSTFITPEKMLIATVPIGYGDGYPRQLSNLGRVIVRGQYAPIVGRICMDQFMIDVSKIEGVMQDDVVTVVGSDKDACIPVEEPARLANSFNYEYVCNVGKRIPRVYYKDGKPILVRHD